MTAQGIVTEGEGGDGTAPVPQGLEPGAEGMRQTTDITVPIGEAQSGEVLATREPTASDIAEMLRDFPDEEIRHIADSKDVASCRFRIGTMLAKRPHFLAPTPPKESPVEREAVARAAQYVLDNSRRGTALNDEQFAADSDKLLDAYQDIITKALASGHLTRPAPTSEAWCPTCGNPSPDGLDCLTCARWWSVNPPPGDGLREELARIELPTSDDTVAASIIVDSPQVIGQYAACEWDELGDDGKQWVAAIVREARRADKAEQARLGDRETELFAQASGLDQVNIALWGVLDEIKAAVERRLTLCYQRADGRGINDAKAIQNDIAAIVAPLAALRTQDTSR